MRDQPNGRQVSYAGKKSPRCRRAGIEVGRWNGW